MKLWQKKISFLCIFLSSLITTTYIVLKQRIVHKTEKKLETVLHNRMHTITAQIQTHITKTNTYAQQLEVLTHLEKELPLALPTDIPLVITRPNQTVYASTLPEIPQGAPLIQTPFYTMPISNSVRRALFSLCPDCTDSIGTTAHEKPTFLISVPLFDKNLLQGIITSTMPLEEITQSVTDITDLGTTGEVILAKQTKLGPVFISPLRFNIHNKNNLTLPAFKQTVLGQRISSEYNKSSALRASTLGKSTTEITYDYKGEKVLTLSAYLPEPSWGIVIKMDMDEILIPLSLLFIFLVCVLIATGLWILYLISEVALTFFHHYSLINHILCISLSISGCISVITFVSYYTNKNAILHEEKSALSESVAIVAQNIDQEVNTIEFLAERTKLYLAQQRSSDSIQEHLLKNWSIYDAIVSITVINTNTHESFQKNYSDKIIRAPEETFTMTEWYRDTLGKTTAQWFPYYQDPTTKTLCAVYTLTSGPWIIAYTYDITPLQNLILNLSSERTGQNFLLSNSGHFMYHPLTHYIDGKKTFDQVCEESADPILKYTLQQLKNSHQTSSFLDTYKNHWILYKKIPTTNWALIAIVAKDDIPLPWNNFVNILLLCILCATIFIITTLLLYTYIHKLSPATTSWIITGILIISILTFWYLIRSTSIALTHYDFPITTSLQEKRFITLQQEKNSSSQTPLIIIPTGIFINYLQTTNKNTVIITATLWQRYPKQSTLTRALLLPQAEKSTFQELYRYTTETEEIIAWNCTAELFQTTSHEKYPFDTKHINIALSHPDKTDSLLLVPDLYAYVTTAPWNLPGLSEFAELPGYILTRSSFNYNFPRTTTVIARTTSTTADIQPQLYFTILAQRTLFTPIIAFLFPLIVILIALFISTKFTERSYRQQHGASFSYFSVFSIYTGLFFSLILIHNSLRTVVSGGEIVYLDYLFFCAYSTLVLLQISILIAPNNNDNSLQPLSILTLIYWPLQLGAWIVITFFFFYMH